MYDCIWTDIDIPMAGEVQEKDELKTMLKRGGLFFR